MPDNKSTLDRQAKQWLKARDIIAKVIWKDTLIGRVSCESIAAAIIARLAKEGLLICEADELKE